MIVAIHELKRGDLICDFEDQYKLIEDPKQVDGVWQVLTVSDDYEYLLTENHPWPLTYDPSIEELRMKALAKRNQQR